MEKILISACFLGENVRYDGNTKTLTHGIIDQWQKEQRLVGICPECSGGLSVPRAAAEISPYDGSVFTEQKIDVSNEFTKGASKALKLCQDHKIKYALLKESSPSCGSSLIYDGSFSKRKIQGQGVTTKLLRQYGIKVFSEETIDELIKALNYN